MLAGRLANNHVVVPYAVLEDLHHAANVVFSKASRPVTGKTNGAM